MIILHVTDLHFNQRWFHWLAQAAPPHDLLVLAGDLLDHRRATPQRAQIAWVSQWFADWPGTIALCSGNHDLEWDSSTGRWAPAYWLRDVARPHISIDGQSVVRGGLTVLSLGSAMQPRGAKADIWVVHAPPAGTLVASPVAGGNDGDPDLVTAVHRFAPRLVLSGHIHQPKRWWAYYAGALLLNPGHDAEAAFPNHILIDTDTLDCRHLTARNAPAVVGSALLSNFRPGLPAAAALHHA